MTTLNTQKDFFSTVTSKEFIDNDRVEIYQDLIFLRFEDVIKSSFPLFTAKIQEDILEKYIKEFISYGSHTAFVWKIPFEFAKFLLKTKKIKNKQDKDLLDFELIQIKMYVSNAPFKSTLFKWNKRYRISSNAAVMKTNVDLLNKNDNKEQYILIYKDINDFEVYYIEITKVVYFFFKYTRNNHSSKKALQLACRATSLKFNDVKEIITATINNFCKNGLII